MSGYAGRSASEWLGGAESPTLEAVNSDTLESAGACESSEKSSPLKARERRDAARAAKRANPENLEESFSKLSLAESKSEAESEARSSSLTHFIEFLKEEGGSVAGNGLGRLYLRHPEMRGVMLEAGGLKDFCEAHTELRFADGRARVVSEEASTAGVPQDVPSVQRLLEVLIKFAEAEGGGFASSDISKVYKQHPWTQQLLCDAGGLKQFCAAHPALKFDNGQCTLNSQSQEALPVEFVSIASVLPPSRFEYPEHVAAIIALIERAVSCVQGASVHAFGSSVNGFGDAASDVDLVLEASPTNLKKGLDLGKISRKDLAPRSLAYLQRMLRQQGFRVVEKVLGAKVPILKLHRGGVDCDLSCNNLLPVFNTRLLKAYADIDPRIVDLTQAVKAWARKNEVHGAPHGHFSSYAFTLMSLFYMQMRGALPCLQSCSSESPKMYSEGGKTYNVAMDLSSPRPAQPGVAISLDDFVHFYLNDYKWGNASVVSIRTGKCQGIENYPDLKTRVRDGVGEDEAQELLHIEDPFDVSRNMNCVMQPGHTVKLWCALEDAKAAGVKPPPLVSDSGDFPPLDDFPPVGSKPKASGKSRGLPNKPNSQRVWRSQGWQ